MNDTKKVLDWKDGAVCVSGSLPREPESSARSLGMNRLGAIQLSRTPSRNCVGESIVKKNKSLERGHKSFHALQQGEGHEAGAHGSKDALGGEAERLSVAPQGHPGKAGHRIHREKDRDFCERMLLASVSSLQSRTAETQSQILAR